MQKTEKRYWKNGFRKYGGWFNTLTLSLFNFGIMFIWGVKPNTKEKVREIKTYKLI
jgi:hypothetical protein